MSANGDEGEVGHARSLKIGGSGHPLALDPARARAWLGDLERQAQEAGCSRLAALCREDGQDARRLGAILDLSPYLNGAILRRPDWLEVLFDMDAGARLEAILARLRDLPVAELGERRLMTILREAKLEAALLIALRDLFGACDGVRTTADLSDLAEASIRAALRFLLVDLDRRGVLRLASRERPEDGCGLFVLGMGKLGGRELNYSSDIDLIILFDPHAHAVLDAEESVETFSRLARRLVRILNDRTGDGYVFRTDLRLRPDPGAMPLAIPVVTALTYYEDRGRNWERAALLKARCVGGDEAAAAAFIREIAPFVWRKYLDFNAISEIQAMKQRIDTHRGFEGVSVAGHNVKLGPGGIREVEFFAQAQQLIAGGRAAELRTRRTDEALEALAAAGWLSKATARRMTEAYWYLRRVEHMIQMVADEQSHTLPETPEGLARIAGLMGFEGPQAFERDLLQRLSFVEGRFDDLFSNAEEKGQTLAAMIENGDGAALARMLVTAGFARPDSGARTLAAWGTARYRAMRSAAARQHLARVLPELIESFAASPDPDGALIAFDSFLAGLPSGIQFFSLLASNPRILDLLTLIVTASPLLSARIAERPHVFDALLDPSFFREASTPELLARRLDTFLVGAEDYEQTLVRLRLFASDQRFLVGTRLLSGATEGEAAGLDLSDIADLSIARLLRATEGNFAARHGRVPGGRVALFGMGRLGSRELTAGSDVDLILFYDHPETALESDGEKPLPASTYYARLTQRLIAAISAPMGEGVLYEVDFRLRPSGNKGPLATNIDAFKRYQATEARTWERMALTRSRFIAGDAAFGAMVTETIRSVLHGPRDAARIGADVADMRALIEREKPARGALDLKLRPGGVIDLEFLAQWAILSGRVPSALIGHPTKDVLAAIGGKDGTALGEAALWLSRVLHLVRLGPSGGVEMAGLPSRLGQRIAESLEVAEADAVEARLTAITADIRERFRRILDD